MSQLNRRKIVVFILFNLFLAQFAFVSGIQQAKATVSTTVASVYVDRPFVQGSYARHFGGVTELFNDQSSGQRTVTSNSQSIVGGTKTAGSYTVFSANDNFGANTSTETATAGGSGSGFANTDATGFEISFTTPVKYIGFYWAAGNATNYVKFFSGSTEISSFSTADLGTLLGTCPGSDAAYAAATDSITATDGTNYFKKYYFGPKTGYTSTAPTVRSTIQYVTEPYAYVHVFAQNDESFDRLKIYGAGFEFDNLTVSTQEVPIRNSLVLVNDVTTTLTLGESAWNFKGVTATDTTTPSTGWLSDSSTVTRNSQISIQQDLTISSGTITMGRTALFQTPITNAASNTCGSTFTLIESYTATDAAWIDIDVGENGSASRVRLVRGFCYKWTLDPSSNLGSGAVRPTSSAANTRFNSNLESPMVILPEVTVTSCSGAGTLVNGDFETLPSNLQTQSNTTNGDPNSTGIWHGYASNSNPKQILFLFGADDTSTSTYKLNGWRTSATDGYIEIQRAVSGAVRTNGTQNFDSVGVLSASGNYHAELAARQLSTLYQDISTIPGTVIRWSIKHRARSTTATDSMQVRIGSTSSQTAQTVLQRRSPNNNDVYLAPTYSSTFDAGWVETSTISTSLADGWREYRGAYTVPASQTTTRFAFSAFAGSSSVGNLLDDIRFSPLIACPATLTVPAGRTVTINPFDIDSSGNPLGNDAIDSYGWSDAFVTETITASAGTATRTGASNRSISYTAPTSTGIQSVVFQIANPQGDKSSSTYTITVVPDSKTRAPGNVPMDPRTLSYNLNLPQITTATGQVLACVQQSDSTGTVISSSLRFDVGNQGTTDTFKYYGSESVTITSDQSNSIQVSGSIAAVNKALDSLWVTKNATPARLSSNYYIRIASVVTGMTLYNQSNCSDALTAQIKVIWLRPITLIQTRSYAVPQKNGKQR